MRVVTFGEIMLRLAPEGYYRFVQADKYGATYGGGEANVAVSCANYGHEAYFVTKLPKHEIGQSAVNALRKYGVNIPPLINAYMGLSPTMRVFGTAVNHDFGNVEETGILMAFEEILEQKRIRHIESFAQNHPEAVDFFKDYFLAKNKNN